MKENRKEVDIHEDEDLQDLQRNGLRIIQKKTGFRFCTDSVLLADFCKATPDERIADLGTGSGVIPLLIAARKGGKRIDGIELQGDISEMATRNVILNGMEDRIRIHCCDIRKATDFLGYEQMDLIVTNPPYLQYGKGLESPNDNKSVARGGKESCPIEIWMSACGKLARNGGRICTVFPASQLIRLCDAMRSARIEPKRLRIVLSRPDREPKLILLEGRKQGNPGLRILPPLITHDAQGGFSDEMKRIYGEQV